ncbi:hypothetical protein L3081_20015 [Colwellia sp. MSW7]|uniref:Uncharacterized protein n=1 Tax=Colwellia maritima TaxID=2912588 RepID=A0ABS9X4U4_9GAMM|nr:hypothetical protein [Colwellia maritima]MCI2285244.1 hypothetical protein [Colwellia maritima]
MKEINATATDASGAETSTNILKSDSPTITSSDDYITALYSLISSNNDRLTAIDGPQELVLALGEEEQLITIGEDQSITFSNIEHLSQLAPEDFLSIRLYTNNDASNILWEYAFLTNDLDIDSDNNNGFSEPDSSGTEERMESKFNDLDKPGKLIVVDASIENVEGNDNTLPGFANYFGIKKTTFVPLVIHVNLGEQGDRDKTLLQLSYYASVPKSPAEFEYHFYDEDAENDGDEKSDKDKKQYIPSKGVLRVWTKKSTQDRNYLSVIESGDFVPTDILIRLSQLPELVDDKLTLYVEVVGISELPGNYLIQAKIVNL